MRWIEKEERCVRRFALLPICINGENRWFETVYIIQRMQCDGYDGYWRNECFVDKEVWETWEQK